MTVKVLNGYIFDEDDIRGVCPDHEGPLINVVHVVHDLELMPDDLSDFIVGLWGVGWCPIGRHFKIWKLPEFKNRPGSTEENPLGYPLLFPLDK